MATRIMRKLKAKIANRYIILPDEYPRTMIRIDRYKRHRDQISFIQRLKANE